MGSSRHFLSKEEKAGLLGDHCNIYWWRWSRIKTLGSDLYCTREREKQAFSGLLSCRYHHGQLRDQIWPPLQRNHGFLTFHSFYWLTTCIPTASWTTINCTKKKSRWWQKLVRRFPNESEQTIIGRLNVSQPIKNLIGSQPSEHLIAWFLSFSICLVDRKSVV